MNISAFPLNQTNLCNFPYLDEQETFGLRGEFSALAGACGEGIFCLTVVCAVTLTTCKEITPLKLFKAMVPVGLCGIFFGSALGITFGAVAQRNEDFLGKVAVESIGLGAGAAFATIAILYQGLTAIDSLLEMAKNNKPLHILPSKIATPFNLRANEICSICRERIKYFQTIYIHTTDNRVNHTFHYTCMETWADSKLTRNEPVSCPTCRTILIAQRTL